MRPMTLVATRAFRPSPPRADAPPKADPPELREVDLSRIHDALTAAHAPGTLRTYALCWGQFERWCDQHGHTALPAHPATVAAFLSEQAAAGKSLNSLDVTCSAIYRRHTDHGFDSPTSVDAVRRVRRGLRRIHGTAVRRHAHPLDLDDIQRMIATIDRTRPTGIRDAAMILLGFASALRVSEIAGLTLDDLQAQPGGILLHIRQSKTDSEKRGQVVGVAAGRHPDTDPITALDAWLDLRGNEPGPVFTSMRGVWRNGIIRIESISPNTVSYVVNQRARAAGLPAERITGHSLRAGHATTAAVAGVPIDQIAAQTRHRQIDVLLNSYIRPAQTLQRTSSQHLGL